MNPLDPLDAAMMTAELLFNPLHVGAVLILSAPKDAGRDYVDQLHRGALTADDPVDSRLRRYPHRGVETGGIWVWRQTEILDMKQHCQRRTASGGRDGLWQLIGELHAQPLDRSRPMWMSYLIDGFDSGHFAFFVKIHHSVVDGVAGFRMIADALTTDPTRRSIPPFYADRQPKSAVSRTRRGPNLVGTVKSGIGLIERVVTGEVSNLVEGLAGRTTVLPFGAPYTRFNGRLGPERVVAADSWPKDRIKAIQTATGVTGNDVVTTAIAGALRCWLLGRGELPEKSLVAICPITVRGDDVAAADGLHGNRFGAWLCPLGTNLADPVARLDLIHRSMADGKHWVSKRGSAASLLTVAASMAATVLPPLLPIAPKVGTGYNVPISHLRGPESQMYWNGAHLEEIYPVSAVYDGQALNVTTCSYARRIGFGYVAGRDTVPDVAALTALTEKALTELESAVGARQA
ncbi:MAG TPA: wax ester/triacylglycerol synthase family O-acyltransferase [Mycobacterium sp.]|uniref:wax ester/triacylglycerol synthase family O-acyltransferase n=1 Tax=Mycobacterium sp. TaxID=1785 RepID=UPI002D44B540|nr:wax ester/triacylglycerol synthase family O-acyltransferase [Mycobacterium sp.]HXY66409.1 wax ester/triacylglycerol synthase family O-acyltransferase [Mycobacterium sp.]